MNEIWKDIKGYEGLYQVSNYGRVKRLTHRTIFVNGNSRTFNEMIIKPYYNRVNGYYYIKLSKNGVGLNHSIHRLVASAFIPLIKGKDYVNHLDLDKGNNIVNNLEWCSNGENIKHAMANGLYIQQSSKPIKIYKNNVLIGIFKSKREASRITGISRGTIKNCNNWPNSIYKVYKEKDVVLEIK